MWLWRLSGADYAERFDGGYGYRYDGRWNTRGRPVTYCSTGPALCLLEKLAHIDDMSLLPDDTLLVCFDAPEDMGIEFVQLDALPDDWLADDRVTQSMGDAWFNARSACLLSVPSAVVPVSDTADRNILVNHSHEDAGRISISRVEPFRYDPRLLRHRSAGGQG